MFEVNPCVRVAPDQDGEEEHTDAGGDKHDEETKETLVTSSH